MYSFFAFAQPEQAKVMHGEVNLARPDSQTLEVRQKTDKAILHWHGFHIAPGETTRFIQPHDQAITLNRVARHQHSQILGNLSANGRIILVNPTDIYFGPQAKVDVGSLLATTANIKNEDFFSEHYLLEDHPASIVSVINDGTLITRDQGLIALVAPTVENNGVIHAHLGKVSLGASGALKTNNGNNVTTGTTASFRNTTLGAGNLTVTSGRAISQAARNAGNTANAGTTNDVTLNNAGNNFGTINILATNNLTLTDMNSLILGASTVNGDLSLTSNGAITQTAALDIEGMTTLSPGAANSITLNNGGNIFNNTIIIPNATNVTLQNTVATYLGTSII